MQNSNLITVTMETVTMETIQKQLVKQFVKLSPWKPFPLCNVI